MNFTRIAHCTLGGLLLAGSFVLVGCADPVPSAAALVTGETGITAIATDDFFVYWSTQDGSVKRVSIDGGKPTTLISGQPPASTLAVDETHLFWASSDGQIARTPKEGGAAEPLAEAGHDTGFAIDPTHIYFTTSEGTVQKRAKDDGATTDLAAQQKVRSQFAIGGSSLVFATPPEDAAAVSEMRTDSGAVDTLVSGPRPDFVAISGSNLYWTNTGDQTVGVAQRDGSSVFQIPALGAQPSSVMGDDTYVYFADVSGAVNVATIRGGDAVQIAKGPTGKVSMAMDQTSIYWANSIDGSIITMPRQ
jgi:hypothetical protein